MHLSIRQDGHQVLPTNPDESFHYDNYPHIMDTRIELFAAPFRLRAVGWGEDCSYDHEVIIGVGILLPESFMEYQEADTRLAKLFAFFGMR